VKSCKVFIHLLLDLFSFPIAIPFIFFSFLFEKFMGNIFYTSMIIGKIPFIIGEKARYFYYKALLLHVGKEVKFGFGSYFQYRKSAIGNRVLIGCYNSFGEIEIGDNVLIGGYCNFLSGLKQHSFDNPDICIWDSGGDGRKMIKIGSDVWIGSNSVIGACVEDRCVIAAGSVVVKDVEAFSVMGGNPAKLIKRL